MNLPLAPGDIFSRHGVPIASDPPSRQAGSFLTTSKNGYGGTPKARQCFEPRQAGQRRNRLVCVCSAAIAAVRQLRHLSKRENSTAGVRMDRSSGHPCRSRSLVNYPMKMRPPSPPICSVQNRQRIRLRSRSIRFHCRLTTGHSPSMSRPLHQRTRWRMAAVWSLSRIASCAILHLGMTSRSIWIWPLPVAVLFQLSLGFRRPSAAILRLIPITVSASGATRH